MNPDINTLSVSQLNREARFLLEGNFPAVLVEGEISNIAMPASGHWYLTLKDKNAQVRCAMFRNRNQSLRFKPSNGMQVLLKAKLSLYEGRGDYQLIVERMEELGDGALRQAYEELKAKLLKEGLFDSQSKQELPKLPKHVGIITSPTGAAIQDMLSVFQRRFPAITITIIPVTVQGNKASSEMIRAIQIANAKQAQLQDLDVIIIGRGGGSLEDLWSFNDEQLARSIYHSKLPIISAVGHEVDFTIADFAADLRAATPSAAAELLSPDQQDYYNILAAYQQQFNALIHSKLSQQTQQINWLSKQLKHPGRRLQEQAQKLDGLESQLNRLTQDKFHRLRNSVNQLQQLLQAHSPHTLLKQYQQHNKMLKFRLLKAIKQLMKLKFQELIKHSHSLNTVNPLSTLSRGYSITYINENQVLTDYTQAKPGDIVRTKLHNGEVLSIIDSHHKEPPAKPK